ncbi:helix-turn-helix domain-containing protein [Porcincola intestinalis]|uniref:helix-turn-helix domain-containing protein n=1 Tax=Porcincola intestinalis TaxID=2606632 RepID=UPI002FE6CA64
MKNGKFIASCRKEQGMTQAVLAEKLGISDRAISKWETGKSMPDSGIMLDLCELMKINVNELLLIVFALVMIFAVAFIAVGIEQKAGYYECQNCHHRYVPYYLGACGDYRIIVRRIKINTLFLFLFEGRSPSGKLNELLIGTMIKSLVFIQFGDFCHFFLR